MITKHLVFLFALGITDTIFGANIVLVANGPVVNGSSLSILAAPSTTFGFGVQTAANNAVAEDFVVPSGTSWQVSELRFFSYQTGSSSFTFQQATWSITAGTVDGSVVASGLTNVTDGGLLGYRVTDTTLTNTQRGIYQINADIPDFTLSQGTYFLRWSLTGTLASGPWQPPTSDAAAGNALQSNSGGTFATLVDTGSGLGVSLPFSVVGNATAVPEASVAGLGCMMAALLSLRRRR